MKLDMRVRERKGGKVREAERGKWENALKDPKA